MEDVPGMRQYQIVQEEPAKVVVNVVPGPAFDSDARMRIAEQLQPVLTGVQVGVRVVDAIPRDASGKYRVVRTDVGRG